jgi:hypothetical protein
MYVKTEVAITVVELLMMSGELNSLKWLSGNSTQPWQLPATINVCKNRSCNYSF